MKITEENPIHFFVKDQSCDRWYRIELEAFLEIPQHDDTSDFRTVEDIRLFMSTDLVDYECGTFQIDFGRADGIHSWAKTLKELIEIQARESSMSIGFSQATKEEYLKLREKAFNIYLKHPKTDYEGLKLGSEFR